MDTTPTTDARRADAGFAARARRQARRDAATAEADRKGAAPPVRAAGLDLKQAVALLEAPLPAPAPPKVADITRCRGHALLAARGDTPEAEVERLRDRVAGLEADLRDAERDAAAAAEQAQRAVDAAVAAVRQEAAEAMAAKDAELAAALAEVAAANEAADRKATAYAARTANGRIPSLFAWKG